MHCDLRYSSLADDQHLLRAINNFLDVIIAFRDTTTAVGDKRGFDYYYDSSG